MTEYKQKAVRNTLFNVLQILTKLLVGFLLPPFILFKLGANIYGAWVLMMAIGAYVSMFDVGISTALVKFISEYYTQKNFQELNAMLYSILLYCLSVGALFFCVIYGFRNLLVSLFFSQAHIEAHLTKRLLLFSSGICALNMAGNVFMSVLVGIQRLDISNLINLGGFLMNALTVVVLLSLGKGIFAVALGWAISIFFSLVLAVICVGRLIPEFRLIPTRIFFFTNIRKVFQLGISDFMVRLSGIAVSQLDKFLLGYFAGLNWVGLYDLAMAFVMQLRSLPVAIFSVLTPLATELKIRKGQAGIRALYEAGLRYLNASGLPIFIFAIVFAYPIISAWLGPQYIMVAWALQFIAVGNYINLLNGPAYYISLGLGQPRVGIYFSLCLMAITFALSPALISSLGYPGAIFSYTLASSISSLLLLWNFHRYNSFSALKFYRRYLILPAAMIIPGALLLRISFHLSAYPGRWGIVRGLIPCIIVFLLFSGWVFWRMQLVARSEWDLVFSVIKGEKKNAS